MHYLVTGGCGFIGSHLVDLLLANGHTVTVIDDLSTGKRQNIPSHVNLIVADITVPGAFDDILSSIDGCFHLAAIVSVQKSTEEWLRTFQVNQGGIVALFDAMIQKKHKVPVVFASSAASYGDCPDIPLKESAPCVPLSPYGVDKLTCELHARIASALHSIPAIGLRFFNVYGTRQDPASPYSGVISIFASRMKQNLPIAIFGDGEQTRDFIYVGDIVRGLMLSMNTLENKTKVYGVYNLCTGTQISINILAKSIAQITKSTSSITYKDARAGDIRFSAGNPEKSRNELGFNAETPLLAGLDYTLSEV